MNKDMGKKILVLGGNGFIGRNLCMYLAEKGEQVYSFDMALPTACHRNICYLQGDFFDDYVMKQIIQDKDIIYHAICTLNPGNSNEKYLLGYERDFTQTVKLCSYIEDSKTRLIYLSSGGTVYGNQDVQPITEEAVPYPINHYGNLKLCIENTMHIFNIQMHRNLIVARISNPYGPGQDYKKGVGFIDAVIKKALGKEEINVWGDGLIIRDYIYITDVCRMLYALGNYNGKEEVFNLSSNRGASQNEIVGIVKEIAKDVRVRYLPPRPVDAKRIILNNKKIMDIDRFDMVPLEKGIRMYYHFMAGSDYDASSI